MTIDQATATINEYMPLLGEAIQEREIEMADEIHQVVHAALRVHTSKKDTRALRHLTGVIMDMGYQIRQMRSAR